MPNDQGANVSDSIAALYENLYAGDAEREWRDVSARYKALNIQRAWQASGGSPKPRVVELGCGEGAVAAAMADLGFFGSYIGFDISTSGVQAARARGVPGATFEQTDGGGCSVEADGADLVVMSHVIEHLEHPRQLMYEAVRVAPVVVVEVPLELTWTTPRDYKIDALGHINKYNGVSLRHFVQSCGLVVREQFTTNPGRDAALFFSSGHRSKMKWRVKQIGLRIAPRLARATFSFHETILAEREQPPRG